MKAKTKKTIKISYIVICILAGLGAFTYGASGFLGGIILLIAGLIMIPNIIVKIPVLQSKTKLPLFASIILFFVGAEMLPNTDRRNNAPMFEESSAVVSETTSTSIQTTTSEITTTTETTTALTTTTTEATTTIIVTTTTPAPETQPVTHAPVQQISNSYVLNTSTMKIHKPTCRDVKKINAANYADFYGTFQEALNMGYSACGHCHPY